MKGEYKEERHVGKVIQVMGPVLDIRFQEGQLPELLNAIEIENQAAASLQRLPSRSVTMLCAALR